ncbi:MAG: hypothetical protein A2X87_04675 [Deltaproteobacteria bacterium GWC2_42_51]|nr:MAG: hypothetical protein A2067_08310 [Deltaproteobacteria bacterium GWB2_42_7]OGP34019.1 MAG: hypothetical protein A2X87_04675 [Deltaproteobacteria bacterium GWC2_42_51]OGP37866.1 MAG: hypothetical protein A2090_00580 [Deltaproteobacteria bacterium GWD2_42_10]OGP48016.1 MAG: hypothetical protein A2022_11345 [Deltaproteobacteria bacterium GWF2_42_12]OGQ29763.1 MAG: hypothetical protein A3D29_02705 [Deltaproteobacteria bacterium RIFCSPHIGHO2_02_FULL_42_44]OGQ38715.1 MAG: hypothetical protein
MKAKLSTAIEKPLINFLDSLPGESRSEKLERLLKKVKRIKEEKKLRSLLSGCKEGDDEKAERESWESTVEEAMWSK